jgi:protein O-mannosyl-transferase
MGFQPKDRESMNFKLRGIATPKLIFSCTVVLLAVVLAYANHFHNGFHFDDFHTVENNPAIRSLSNIPSFFKDGRTFSVLPSNASYRPLVTTTLAVDYWLSGGLDPFWFHVGTFVLFLVQLTLMFLLFASISKQNRSAEQAGWLALFAAGFYGVHPASAETVNYVVQRADLHAALGVVGSLAIYCLWPKGRKWGIYLLPVALSGLSKLTGLVFPAVLFTYHFLFESDHGKPSLRRSPWHRAAVASIPSIAACGGVAIFLTVMTPKTFSPGATSKFQYLITQPVVLLHYFKTFFLPTGLTADTDRGLLSSMMSPEFFAGFAFVVALITAACYTARRRETKAVSFGLWWFLITSLPTSLFPLAEVENDHRMFLPFVGLALAATTTVAVWLDDRRAQLALSGTRRALVAGVATCVLAVSAYGTHVRNDVWRTEDSLWKDVTIKSPHNGRGLMNYGLTLMAKGNSQEAYDYYQKAAVYTPNYSYLEINMGIAAGELGRDIEAEQHFQRAISLMPNNSQSYSYYGRWLHKRGRIEEAIKNLAQSTTLNSADLMPRNLLMQIYSQRADWVNVKKIADEVLRLSPNDADALRYAAMVANPANATLSAEEYLTLSLRNFQNKRYEDCIQAAKEALRLRPDYAEAYNNIAAAYQSLGRWDEAIAAAREALRLKPDFQLAQNNLAYATSQKATIRN